MKCCWEECSRKIRRRRRRREIGRIRNNGRERVGESDTHTHTHTHTHKYKNTQTHTHTHTHTQGVNNYKIIIISFTRMTSNSSPFNLNSWNIFRHSSPLIASSTCRKEMKNNSKKQTKKLEFVKTHWRGVIEFSIEERMGNGYEKVSNLVNEFMNE